MRRRRLKRQHIFPDKGLVGYSELTLSKSSGLSRRNSLQINQFGQDGLHFLSPPPGAITKYSVFIP